jgi:hypothetical protein
LRPESAKKEREFGVGSHFARDCSSFRGGAGRCK